MLRPSHTDIPDLLNQDEAFYAEWLKLGLHTYLFGSRNFEPHDSRSFPFASPFIGMMDSVDEDLAEIYTALPYEDKIVFTKACARALETLDVEDSRQAAVAEMLIRLGGVIKAHPLLPVLANVARRDIRKPGAERLYRLALEVASGLAGPGHPEAALHIAHMIRLRVPFPPLMAKTALLALAAAKPSALLQHLQLLHQPLENAYGPGATQPNLENARRYLILEVADKVFDDGALLKTVDAGSRNPAGPQRCDDTTDWWAKLILSDNEPRIVDLRRRLGIEEWVSTVEIRHEDSPKNNKIHPTDSEDDAAKVIDYFNGHDRGEHHGGNRA